MIYIVLPTYNEECVIGLLLRKIDEVMEQINSNYEILIVDDGSTDRTLEVINSFIPKMSIRLFEHKKNEGLGRAIKTGLEQACRNSSGEDIIITMDADNTHDPYYIKPLTEAIQQGYNMAIASRYKKGGKEIGLPFHRHVFSKIINIVLKVVFPIKNVRDYTSGYRAYRTDSLSEAFSFYNGKLVEEKGFLCMAEILIKLSRVSLNAVEVPLELHYDRKVGFSKMNVPRTIAEYLLLIAKRVLLGKRQFKLI